MQTRRLRCFIAMAFDHADTDRIYSKVIRPLLQKLQIVPVRVDKVEFQERVDSFIIKQLEECDLAIADLTYARPSVYYEAGYAERIKDVIYTSRRDHLKSIDDTARVHFDLQTKNIVGWKDPSDSTFAKRLERRIRFVSKPLLKNQAEALRVSKERASFEQLPIDERVAILESECIDLLRAAGYQERPRFPFSRYINVQTPHNLPYGEIRDYTYTEYLQNRFRLPADFKFVGVKSRGNQRRAAIALCAPSFSSSVMKKLDEYLSDPPLYDISLNNVSEIVEHVFLCSTAPIPKSKAMNSFSTFHDWHDELAWRSQQYLPKRVPPPFGELYVGWKHMLYVARAKPSDFATALRKDEGDQWWTQDRKRVPTRLIDRHVHIVLLGGLRSEKEAQSALTTAIERAESEKRLPKLPY